MLQLAKQGNLKGMIPSAVDLLFKCVCLNMPFNFNNAMILQHILELFPHLKQNKTLPMLL